MNTTGKNLKFQPPTINDAEKISRRELIEKSKLSRLPAFEMPDLVVVAAAACAGCGNRLPAQDSEFQKSIRACRKCLGIYSRIDSAIDDAAKRKRREILEKFAAEVKR
jgi:hypothetical protein